MLLWLSFLCVYTLLKVNPRNSSAKRSSRQFIWWCHQQLEKLSSMAAKEGAHSGKDVNDIHASAKMATIEKWCHRFKDDHDSLWNILKYSHSPKLTWLTKMSAMALTTFWNGEKPGPQEFQADEQTARVLALHNIQDLRRAISIILMIIITIIMIIHLHHLYEQTAASSRVA